MRRFDTRSVHYTRDERREVREGVLKAGRNARMSEPWQIGPNETVLLRHSRHPGVPLDARLVVAMDEDYRFRRAPGFTQPIFPVEEVFLEVRFGLPNGRTLGTYRLRCQRRCENREPEQRRTPRNRSSHVNHLSARWYLKLERRRIQPVWRFRRCERRSSLASRWFVWRCGSDGGSRGGTWPQRGRGRRAVPASAWRSSRWVGVFRRCRNACCSAASAARPRIRMAVSWTCTRRPRPKTATRPRTDTWRARL